MIPTSNSKETLDLSIFFWAQTPGEVFHYDFIEIGTSNYHTFTQAPQHENGNGLCLILYLQDAGR